MNETILIIEDERDICNILKDILVYMGNYDVLEAESGEM
jgi:DNA-binding NtrC family response regulator